MVSEAKKISGLKKKLDVSFERTRLCITMAKFTPPEQFDFSKPETWPDWEQRLFKSFTFTSATDGNEYAVVMAKSDEHFILKRNVIYELAENCDFGVQKDEQMRDRVVIGIRDK